MSSSPISNKKITSAVFRAKKESREPITMLTAYDYLTARALDLSGIDSILVGDSLGMVVLGYENTLPVTMEDMIHHCKAVARGASRALLIGDMPFMSYQVNPSEALRNAGRFLQEAGMDAVKLEGGRERLDAVRAIVGSGIPVLGHLGLTPQSVNQLGGFKVQARDEAGATQLVSDAVAMQQAGAQMLVVECIPATLGREVALAVDMPVIGIGAGVECDGQVLVMHDMLGLGGRVPRFVKNFMQGSLGIQDAFEAYVLAVREQQFPTVEHEY